MTVYKDGRRVRLVSRQGIDHTRRFHELAANIARLRVPGLVLDGEVAVFDAKLVSRFDLLGDPDPAETVTPPVLVVFDCLQLGRRDLRPRPLRERRRVLEDALDGAEGVFPVRQLGHDGAAAWTQVQERGWEGIVGKNLEAGYQAGPTKQWLKVKVPGYRPWTVAGPRGARSTTPPSAPLATVSPPRRSRLGSSSRESKTPPATRQP
jgi:bifunctional non-homologous end joining protein LigD